MAEPSPDVITRAQEAGIEPEVLQAAVERELTIRRAAAIARRAEKKAEQDAAGRQPETGRHRAVTSGAWKRRTRPVAQAEDRHYVPAALEHYRRVHGLSPSQAQARIGYAPRSSIWRQWESGVVAPPYLALLKIIAATGLGYWEPPGAADPEHRLESLATEASARRRARRDKRRAKTQPDEAAA